MLSTLACCFVYFLLFFFFNDTATTEIYTLSLHDALPICAAGSAPACALADRPAAGVLQFGRRRADLAARSEEHTSELQSQSNLVCRLLLEKKKKKHNQVLISLSNIQLTYLKRHD